MPKPNIGHGAGANGSSWGKVISRRAPDGYNIVAVQNSMAALSDDDAAGVRNIIARRSRHSKRVTIN
jgi:hypothetical protein